MSAKKLFILLTTIVLLISFSTFLGAEYNDINYKINVIDILQDTDCESLSSDDMHRHVEKYHPGVKFSQLSFSGELDLSNYLNDEMKIKARDREKASYIISKLKYEYKNFSFNYNDAIYWVNDESDNWEKFDRYCEQSFNEIIRHMNTSKIYKRNLIMEAVNFFYIDTMDLKLNTKKCLELVNKYIKYVSINSAGKKLGKDFKEIYKCRVNSIYY